MEDDILVLQQHFKLWIMIRQRYLTLVSVLRKCFLDFRCLPVIFLSIFASTTQLLIEYAEVLPLLCGGSSEALVCPHTHSQEIFFPPRTAAN